MLQLSMLNEFTGKDFEDWIKLYTKSFPKVELRPYKKVIHQLKNNDNYYLLIAKEQDKLIGFTLLYLFPKLRTGLLDYEAIEPKFQRKGIGTKLFNYTFLHFKQLINQPICLFLEIQKEDTNNQVEKKKRINRIKFYRNLGIKNLENVRYFIPPQYSNIPEEVYLMFKPVDSIIEVNEFLIKNSVDAIYRQVYEYNGKLSQDVLRSIEHNKPIIIR